MSLPIDRLDGATRRAVAAAALAVFVGVGLSRFAYGPMMPAMIDAGWFSPAAAAYLGAANLAGYLLGAIAASRIGVATPTALRGLMVLASLSFVASAFPVPFTWYFVWRLLSGIAGGALMATAAPAVLRHVPAGRRGGASGTIFAGVGLGIVLSGSLVPPLLTARTEWAWLGLAMVSFFATGLAWPWWPREHRTATRDRAAPLGTGVWHPTLLTVYAGYALVAVGLVPHMVFWVDFIARGLGAGIAVGSLYWILFGAGALAGPVLVGRLADGIGYDSALRWLLAAAAAGIAAPVIVPNVATVAMSSLLAGSAVSGSVPLVLGQTQERTADPQSARRAWGLATAAFALGQAGAGYGYSFMFATSGAFAPLFLAGAGALVLSLAAAAGTGVRHVPRRRGVDGEPRG